MRCKPQLTGFTVYVMMFCPGNGYVKYVINKLQQPCKQGGWAPPAELGSSYSTVYPGFLLGI